MVDPRYLDAVQLDELGRVMRSYCLAHNPKHAGRLTADQHRELDSGMGVVIVTVKGELIEVRPHRQPSVR